MLLANGVIEALSKRYKGGTSTVAERVIERLKSSDE